MNMFTRTLDRADRDAIANFFANGGTVFDCPPANVAGKATNPLTCRDIVRARMAHHARMRNSE